MTEFTSAEITRQKEYIRFLDAKIYKLTSKQKYFLNQLEKLKTQIKDYEKEKKKIERKLNKK